MATSNPPYPGATPDSNWSSGWKGVGWYLPELQASLTPQDLKAALPAPPPFDPNADPGYVASTGATNQSTADALASLGISFDASGNPVYSGGKYLQITQNSGFDEAGNPITDPNDPRYNPFSQLNQLKQSFENRKRGTINSYAAQHQLYAGSVLNAQDTDATNYAQNYDSLQRGTKGSIGDLVANALQAKDTGAIANANAGGTALQNSIAQHQNDPSPMLQPIGGAPAPARTSSAPAGHTVQTSVAPSTYTKPKAVIGPITMRHRRRRR